MLGAEQCSAAVRAAPGCSCSRSPVHRAAGVLPIPRFTGAGARCAALCCLQAVDLVEQWDRALEARLLTPAGVRLSEQPVAPPAALQLRALSSNAEFVSMDSLDTAVRMCPFATAISISGSWLPSEALYKVTDRDAHVDYVPQFHSDPENVRHLKSIPSAFCSILIDSDGRGDIPAVRETSDVNHTESTPSSSCSIAIECDR